MNYNKIKNLFDKLGFKTEDKNNFYFIQMSDFHIGDENYKIDERIIEEVKNFTPKPSFIVLTGDILINRKKSSRKKFQEIISSLSEIAPLKIIEGNHDVVKFSYYKIKIGLMNFFFLRVSKKPLYKLNPHSSGGYLDKIQINWLEKEIEKCKEKEGIVIFVHHPPIDYECHLLRMQLEKLLLLKNKEIWIISGHVHENLLFRRLLPDGKTFLNIVVTPTVKESYRIFCVEGEKIKRSILREVNGKFKIDPLPEKWQFYIPSFEGVGNVIFSALFPDDEKYIIKIKGLPWGKGEPWGEESHRRLYGKDGVLIYSIPLSKDICNNKLRLALALAHGYQIEASADGKNWKILKKGGFLKEGTEIVNVPLECIKKRRIFVRIKNIYFHPDQIHPAAVRGFALLWRK